MNQKPRATKKSATANDAGKKRASAKIRWPEVVTDDRQAALTTADAYEIGKVIVETYYGGERGASRGAGATSVREISDSLGGKFGQVTLNRCAAVYEMCRDLGVEPNFEHLRFAHLSRLTGLTAAQQQRLLKTAEKGAWSVERVQGEVKKLRAGKKNRKGRPPLPGFVKAVNQLERFVDGREALLGDLESASELEPEVLSALRERVDEVLKQLTSLKAALVKLGK